MEYLSFLSTDIGSKELAIGSARLSDKIIAETNQEIDYVDRQGRRDWGFSFGSHKSGNKMSDDFGRNADDKIGMNPSRTILRLCS